MSELGPSPTEVNEMERMASVVGGLGRGRRGQPRAVLLNWVSQQQLVSECSRG